MEQNLEIPENPDWTWVHRIQTVDGGQIDLDHNMTYHREDAWITFYRPFCMEVFCHMPTKTIHNFFPNVQIDRGSKLAKEHIDELIKARDSAPPRTDDDVPF